MSVTTLERSLTSSPALLQGAGTTTTQTATSTTKEQIHQLTTDRQDASYDESTAAKINEQLHSQDIR